eukprot:1158459-Pyramimonas_sp.AAC.1
MTAECPQAPAPNRRTFLRRSRAPAHLRRAPRRTPPAVRAPDIRPNSRVTASPGPTRPWMASRNIPPGHPPPLRKHRSVMKRHRSSKKTPFSCERPA